MPTLHHGVEQAEGNVARRGGAGGGDDRLARMFRYCLEGISTEASTSRWAKDFSAGR